MKKFHIPPGTPPSRQIEMVVSKINELEEALSLLVEEHTERIFSQHEDQECTCESSYTGIHRDFCPNYPTPVRLTRG